MGTKLYCVHVYERPYVYESVRAENAQAAEAQVIAREWAHNYDNISHVEVMRECGCGTDNALNEKACTDCGAPL